MVAPRRRLGFDAARKRVVGLVAFSQLETHGVGRPTRVRFIEELYVSPGYRKQGVASCLLNRALSLHRNGGRYRKTDRVACVLRCGHAQQAAAVVMYRKMGMRPIPARRHLVDHARHRDSSTYNSARERAKSCAPPATTASSPEMCIPSTAIGVATQGTP